MTNQSSQNNQTTVNAEEVEKFSRIASEWWSPTGKFAPLHKFNPVRLQYIKSTICKHFNLDETSPQPLKGISILDIGCGGGLLSAPLARLGATVTGIDASENNIKTAQTYATENSLEIKFINTTAEALELDKQQFDVVLNMEVIEHVDNPEMFVASTANLLKPNGVVFMATLNRTAKAYLFGIIGAEYVMRWLPRGTHDWKKFFRPSELQKMLSANNVSVKEITGVSYNIFSDSFSLSSDLSVNYMLHGVKG